MLCDQANASGAKFKKCALSIRWHLGVVHVRTDSDTSDVVTSEQTEDADNEEEEVVRASTFINNDNICTVPCLTGDLSTSYHLSSPCCYSDTLVHVTHTDTHRHTHTHRHTQTHTHTHTHAHTHAQRDHIDMED